MAGVFRTVILDVGTAVLSTTQQDPYISPTSGCSNETDVTGQTEGSDTLLEKTIRHYKVLTLTLGILTFVFAATSFLLAAMQIGQ